jgi:hypothetical protein
MDHGDRDAPGRSFVNPNAGDFESEPALNLISQR